MTGYLIRMIYKARYQYCLDDHTEDLLELFIIVEDDSTNSCPLEVRSCCECNAKQNIGKRTSFVAEIFVSFDQKEYDCSLYSFVKQCLHMKK